MEGVYRLHQISNSSELSKQFAVSFDRMHSVSERDELSCAQLTLEKGKGSIGVARVPCRKL